MYAAMYAAMSRGVPAAAATGARRPNRSRPAVTDDALPSPDAAIPLVVDVDGTLVAGDLAVEGAARLASTSPLALLAFAFRLARGDGRAALKRRIAGEVALPAATLALNPAVVEEIAAARAGGREVWLASGSDERAVAPLAEAVGATGHFASDGRTNLVGAAKAALLAERFGDGGFDYAGNERRDLAVWRRSRVAVGVGLSARLERELRALGGQVRLLPGPGGGPADYVRAGRPHQWVKNTLVAVPLVAAHETGVAQWAAAALLFAAFCGLASGTYLLNDLLDLHHDRRHPSKRHRPMAAGKVAPAPAMALAAALMAGGLAITFQLSALAGMASLLYLFSTFAYSLWLKRRIIVDVVALSMLYAGRVLAGAAAASIPLSPWFLAFFMFFFLALAAAKRLAELRAMHETSQSEIAGRAYHVDDLPAIAAIGAASGFAALVVFALYANSPGVSELYDRPAFLWLALPPLVYWLGRILLLANRGNIDDPVVFALRDRAAWAVGAAIVAAFAAAL